MKRWTPGRKAIAQMFAYAERFMSWTGDATAHRLGLVCRTQALIYQDRMQANG